MVIGDQVIQCRYRDSTQRWCDGRSMEEEVRVILAQAVARDEAPSSHTPGLGSRIAALFADVELEEPFREWRGVEVEPVPAPFKP